MEIAFLALIRMYSYVCRLSTLIMRDKITRVGKKIYVKSIIDLEVI